MHNTEPTLTARAGDVCARDLRCTPESSMAAEDTPLLSKGGPKSGPSIRSIMPALSIGVSGSGSLENVLTRQDSPRRRRPNYRDSLIWHDRNRSTSSGPDVVDCDRVRRSREPASPTEVSRYFLTLTSFQPLCGKLSDVFGRKPMLLCAFVILGLGCLLCGLARSMTELIVARVSPRNLTGFGH